MSKGTEVTVETNRGRNQRRRGELRRTADPYRDLDVIDSRAPRANQATIGALALVAFLVDWWPLLTILAAQLAIGLRFGRRYCLPCFAYFELVQPRFGEGPTEDSRPPRFANQVGLVVLTGASIAHVAGLEVLGWGLGLLVAALALLAAATGFCAGCELYKVGARLRGIYGETLQEIDLSDLGVDVDGEVTVLFTHPLCTDCHQVERELNNQDLDLVRVDVRTQRHLARKYGISVVPTVVTVDSEGKATLVRSGE